jgi:methionyl-tRNA formyltransferase
LSPPRYIFMAIREHPWGREMLARLLEAGFAPALIIEEDSDGGEVEREKFEYRIGSHPVGPPMADQARKQGIPVVTVPIHNDEHCMGYLEEAEPELIVFGGTRIIRGAILEYGDARGGVLNAHPGLLPECRGSASPAWSVYLDIPIGASCHFCSATIDAGDLAGRREIPVRRGATYQDLCHATLVEAARLMAEAVAAYADGWLDELRTPQGDSEWPTYRYDAEIERAAIAKLERGEYRHYVD